MSGKHRSGKRVKTSTQRKRAEHHQKRGRIEPYQWLGAGAVAFGVGAAALAGGSGVAHADAGSDGSSTAGSSGAEANSSSTGSSSAGSSDRSPTGSAREESATSDSAKDNETTSANADAEPPGGGEQTAPAGTGDRSLRESGRSAALAAERAARKKPDTSFSQDNYNETPSEGADAVPAVGSGTPSPVDRGTRSARKSEPASPEQSEAAASLATKFSSDALESGRVEMQPATVTDAEEQIEPSRAGAGPLSPASSSTASTQVVTLAPADIASALKALSGSSPTGPVTDAVGLFLAAAVTRRESGGAGSPEVETVTGQSTSQPLDAYTFEGKAVTVPTAAAATAEDGANLAEAAQEEADAAFNMSLGWVPVVGTVYNGLSLLADLGQFTVAALNGDVADMSDELGDMAIDAIGMIPIVGGPLAATIHWTFRPSALPNNAPISLDDSFTIAEDNPLSGNVLANDSDVDGNTLSVIAATGAMHGATSVVNNHVVYTPAADYVGSDSFTYTVSDGRGGTSQATVSITITPVNDAPEAYDDDGYYTTKPNTTLNVFANDGLIDWDSYDLEGDPLTATLAANPANGTVDLNADGSFTYTPDFDFVGEDSFTFTVSDGQLTSNVATVSITVTAGNGIPAAYDDYENVRENATLAVPASQGLISDWHAYDPDGDVLTASLVGAAVNGQVVVNSDGSYTYTPNTDYAGADSFTYTVSDGIHTSNTATVTITVHDANEETAPEAYGDSRTADQDSTLTVAATDGLLSRTAAYDNEGDPLTATLAGGPTHGQVTLNADGSYTYTPNSGYTGADSFTYTVSDGQKTSNTATVDISVQSNAYGMETGLALGPDGTVYVLHGTSTFDPTSSSTGSAFAIASRNADGSLTDLVQISSSTSSLPTGLAVGSDGRFYVTDYLDGSVTVYDPNNNYSATTLASISNAAGIAVDRAAGRIYVTTVDYTDANRPSGQLVTLDIAGNQIGHAIDLSGPSTAVTVGPNGAVYVAGLFGGLSVYEHRALQTSISAEDLPGFFYGVTIGSDGTAYIASHEGIDESGDLLDGSVLIVNPADPTIVRQLSGVSQPWGIALVNGLVYVTDLSTRSVVVLDPANATEVTGNTGSGDVTPYSTDVETAIALGADGKIYALHGSQTYNPEGGTTTGVFHLAIQNPDGSFTDVATLGSEPTGVAVGSDGRIYVTDYLAGTVTAYDPTNQYSATTIASIPYAAGIAISGTSGRIYVSTVDYTDADQPSGQLVILSSTGTQIGQPIDLAGPSAGIAVSSGGNVYVTGLLGGLAVYDNNGVLQTSISAADLPGTFYGVAVGADGTAYIANRGSSIDSITVVNPAGPTNIRQFTGVSAPWGVVLANGLIYASSSDTQTLVEFDPATGNPVAGNQVAASFDATLAASTPATSASVSAQALSTPATAAVAASTSTGGYDYATISLGGTPTNVTLSANGARGFVVVGSQVKIIEVGVSTPTITNSVTVGSNPYMVAVNSFGTRAYVTNSGNGTVSIIEKGASVGSAPTVTTVAVGSNPTGIAVNSNGTRAYVANTGSGTVSIINYGSSTPITVAVGSSPTGVAVNSAGTIAYVTNTGGNTVSIIKYNGTGTPTVTTVTVSARPQSVKTSDNGNRAIVYSSGGYVAIIDASGSAAQVPGVHPSYADYPGFTAMSGDGSTAYVTEHNNWRVSVIDTSNPGATPQYSDVSDYTHSIVSLPDGSQAFTVAHDALWVVDSKTLQSVPIYVPVDNNSSESQRIAISSDGKRVIAVSNNGDLTAFYLSGTINTQDALNQWWRTASSAPSSNASKAAKGTVTALVKEFTNANGSAVEGDLVSAELVTGKDGTKRLVVYISGVGTSVESKGRAVDAKNGRIPDDLKNYIDEAVVMWGVDEIMLVGYSLGGSWAQNYAVNGQYSEKVSTVITFGAPLVQKATAYNPKVNVLNLEAKNDPIPQDDPGLAWTILTIFGSRQFSNPGVRETFVNDKTDWKTVYVVDTEKDKVFEKYGKSLAQIKGVEIGFHDPDNYYVAASEYEANAYRWEQSQQIIADYRRFYSGEVYEHETRSF